MLVKKIKPTKKKPEKLPEPVSLIEQGREWLEARQKPIAIGLTVIVLTAAAIWGFNSYRESHEGHAQAAYGQILKDWPAEGGGDEKAWEKISDRIEGFMKEYGESKQAVNAELDLSRVLVQLKKYDQAAMYAEKAMDRTSPKEGLRSLARYELAETYLAAGNDDKAMQELEVLKQEGLAGNMREINWQIAMLYAKTGNYAKAVEQYQKAIEDPGEYPSAAVIEEELAVAKGKAKASS